MIRIGCPDHLRRDRRQARPGAFHQPPEDTDKPSGGVRGKLRRVLLPVEEDEAPGLILAAVLLLKKRRLGYILAPVFLTFIIILAAALIGMVLMLKAKGLSDDTSVAGIFIGLAVVSCAFLFLFLRQLKPSNET